MPENNEMKVDPEGNFFRWEKVLDVTSKIEGATSLGNISGMDLSLVAKHHIGKKFRITIEVRNES